METCICLQKTGNRDECKEAVVASKHAFRHFRANNIRTEIEFITCKLTKAKEIDVACGM